VENTLFNSYEPRITPDELRGGSPSIFIGNRSTSMWKIVKILIFQFLEFSENFFPGLRKTERHEEILFWDWQSIDFGTGIPTTSRNRPVKNQHENKNQQRQQRNSRKQQWGGKYSARGNVTTGEPWKTCKCHRIRENVEEFSSKNTENWSPHSLCNKQTEVTECWDWLEKRVIAENC
jgi:hypothetical protein